MTRALGMLGRVVVVVAGAVCMPLLVLLLFVLGVTSWRIPRPADVLRYIRTGRWE